MQAKAAAASASSTAAASLDQPLWLTPAPIAEEPEPGLPSGSEEDSHSLSSGLQEQAEVSEKKAKVKTLLSSGTTSQLRPMVKAKAQPHALRQLPKPV